MSSTEPRSAQHSRIQLSARPTRNEEAFSTSEEGLGARHEHLPNSVHDSRRGAKHRHRPGIAFVRHPTCEPARRRSARARTTDRHGTPSRERTRA